MKSLHQTSALPTPKVSLIRTKISDISVAALYAGLYTRIARQLGLDPSYVRRVALGERKSAGVAAAISTELERIQQIYLSANGACALETRRPQACCGPRKNRSRRHQEYRLAVVYRLIAAEETTRRASNVLREVAAEAGIAERTLWRWRKAYKTAGPPALADRARSDRGKPRLFDKQRRESIDMKPSTVFEEIGPAKAEEYLQKNTHNRPLSTTSVEKLAYAMMCGLWVTTHQGIAFDVNGVLVDGQTRLAAVKLSGATVIMPVTYNLPAEAQVVIDNGRPRNFRDIRALAGSAIAREYPATLRGMFLVEDRLSDKFTNALMESLSHTHNDAVLFALSCFTKEAPRGVRMGALMGVVARAFYSADHKRLKEFGAVLSTGMPSVPKEDESAIRLRNWRIGSNALAREVYRKTERALLSFLNKEPLTKLYDATEELFPLPSAIAPLPPRKTSKAK